MAAEWTLASGCTGWVLDLGGAPLSAALRILVHQHPAAPAIWCLTAQSAGLDLHELEAQDGAAARAEALELLDRVLARRLALVRQAKGAPAPELVPAARPKVRPARARLSGKRIVVETRKDART